MMLTRIPEGNGDRLLTSLARRNWKLLAGLLASSLALTGTVLLLPAVLGRAVDAAVSRSGESPWLAAGILLVAVSAVAEAGSVLTSGFAGTNATAWLRGRLAARVLAVGHRLPEQGGDLVSRVIGSAAAAGGGPVSVVLSATSVIPPLGAFIALGLIDPWLALAFAVVFPVLARLVRGLARDSARIAADYGAVQGAIAARLLDALVGARTIAAAGTQAAERRRILAPLPELRRHGYATWRVQARAAAQAAVLAPVIQVIVVAVAGLELTRHHLTAGGLAAASQYAELATGIGAITGMVAQLGIARGSARRAAGLLEIPRPKYGLGTLDVNKGALPPSDPPHGGTTRPPIPPAADQRQTAPPAAAGASGAITGPLGLPEGGTGGHAVPPSGVRKGRRNAPLGKHGGLVLRDVTVRRGGQEVLRGLDLVVPGGAVVAVVGRSGAGKSVLTEVAGRLADPDEGTVTLDGADLRTLTRAALREAVVYAFERPHPFGATPREAIGFGAADPPESGLAAAAADAQAAAFIERLPLGYDTPLDDAPLSGGEMQRIGLARAFAHAGPARLLILDDATSSLDTATEMLVSQAITGRLDGRTRLIVAHRAATAARADLVAWLDEGRVRAFGPHRELWQDPGYRALWSSSDDGNRSRTQQPGLPDEVPAAPPASAR